MEERIAASPSQRKGAVDRQLSRILDTFLPLARKHTDRCPRWSAGCSPGASLGQRQVVPARLSVRAHHWRRNAGAGMGVAKGRGGSGPGQGAPFRAMRRHAEAGARARARRSGSNDASGPPTSKNASRSRSSESGTIAMAPARRSDARSTGSSAASKRRARWERVVMTGPQARRNARGSEPATAKTGALWIPFTTAGSNTRFRRM
jgi:hypothetical protein